MNLQELLIKLRGEESIPTAAKRIGITANYYRNIERGYDPSRGTVSTPSPTTLKKIANAFKVDYMELVKAAGYENNIKYNPALISTPFHNHPILKKWYEALPNENIENVEKLFSMWEIMKGNGRNVL